MYADKSKERFAQMNMPVDSILILRECCPHPIASRGNSYPPPWRTEVDRLWRSITQTVKDDTSAVIIALIRSDLR